MADFLATAFKILCIVKCIFNDCVRVLASRSERWIRALEFVHRLKKVINAFRALCGAVKGILQLRARCLRLYTMIFASLFRSNAVRLKKLTIFAEDSLKPLFNHRSQVWRRRCANFHLRIEVVILCEANFL